MYSHQSPVHRCNNLQFIFSHVRRYLLKSAREQPFAVFVPRPKPSRSLAPSRCKEIMLCFAAILWHPWNYSGAPRRDF